VNPNVCQDFVRVGTLGGPNLPLAITVLGW
jgi:hypothetical protein